MIIENDPNALAMAVDAHGVDRLKVLARNDPKSALKETARQFEALMMGALLKSMRETTSQDGLFDNEQTRLYTSLLDQQLAQNLSGRGFGLSEVLERQLSKFAGSTSDRSWTPVASNFEPVGSWNRKPSATLPTAGVTADTVTERAARTPVAAAIQTSATAVKAQNDLQTVPGGQSHAHQFIERMRPYAETASAQTGIPARFLIGHAALESGWGRYEILRADGSPSHNLFGIKADEGWSGEVAEVQTTEYVNGVAVKREEQFRAYTSYDEAFRDYAAFLHDNPRYAQALDATHSARAFARELQAAGYATDPGYADKLAAVIDGRSLRRTVLA